MGPIAVVSTNSSNSKGSSRSSSKDKRMSPGLLNRNFWWMILWFSLNHGTVTTPLIVASSLLDEQVAYIGNGVLYLGTCISGLFLGAPVSSAFGPKVGLLAGMFLYCL